jgi:superfamily II DNA helicase RecQ
MSRAARAKVRDEAVGLEQDRLTRLVASADREVGRCIRRLALVPGEALAWLASIEPDKQGDREFKASENASTLRKYASVWKSYLCYCVRACWLGRDEAEEKQGVRFGDEQWAALCTVVEMLGGGGIEEGGGGPGDRGREAALDRSVFRFSVTSVRQKVGFDVYRSPLVHFMATLAWDGVSKMWIRDVGAVTAKYAGLLWCARLFMLEHVFGAELGVDQAADPDEEVVFEAVEHFCRQVKDWLTRGSFTPVSQMIKWMAYGKGHRRKEGGMPRLMWEAGEKVMCYLGQPLRTVDFCQAAREGVREAAELLDRLLFGRWAELEREIDVRRIRDDLMKGPAGNSFASNEQNAWLQGGPRKVLALAGDSLWDADAAEWRVGRVKRWLTALREFKMAHMGNTHIWGGQPGRGPEVMTMRHCDGEQLIRNIFVFDGQVFVVTDRDKSKAIRDVGIKVARFLPGHVGEMMIAYIAWLAPVEELLLRQEALAAAVGRRSSAAAARAQRSDAASQRLRTAQLLQDGWLWMDARPGFKGRWETAELSRRLVSLTGRFAGIELGVADYRHVSIEMGRKIKGLVVKQVEAVDDDRDWEDGAGDEELTRLNKFDFVFDLQSTHGRRIAARHYAVNMMFPNNLGPDKIESFREVSRLWHCFLEQRPAGDAVPEDERVTDVSNGGGGGGGGGGGSVGVCCYCCRDKDTKRRAPALESDGAYARGVLQKAKRQKLWETSSGADAAAELDGALQRLLGRTAGWRTDEQQDGMRRIVAMKKGEALIVVLPTGGGKSIFFMLPSMMESERGGVSVVVVPFVALIDDIVRRARDLGIDCLRWASAAAQAREHPQRVPQLLVVSADVAGTDEFVVHADMLRSQGRLRRIFVDECHTAITDIEYRERLKALGGVRRYRCPVVMLTATLPVRLERWFRALMVAAEADLLRARTHKPNIRYHVRTVGRGRGAVDGEATRLAESVGGGMSGDQKGVVYCRSKPKSEALAAAIGCACYHSGLDEGVRREALAAWSEGRSASRWIVATTGLGTGIDIAGIVAVVHAEQPYGLVDFVQQTGRGGRRGGEVVDSFIVTDGRAMAGGAGESNVAYENRLAMERFMRTAGCRRVPLGEFMDGAGYSCAVLGGELCDTCAARGGNNGDGAGEVPSGEGIAEADRSTRQCAGGERAASQASSDSDGTAGGAGPVADVYGEEQRRRRTRLDLLQRWLIRVEGRCGTCYIRWLRVGKQAEKRCKYRHGLARCQTVEKGEYLSVMGKPLRLGDECHSHTK